MISVYIHIPFCHKMCNYCDFCKLYYDKKKTLNYLNALENEIKNTYKNEPVKTIYIGGGTPSMLDIDELNKLFEIISIFDISKLEEFTIECNPEDLNIEKLKLFKTKGINRISIGVQSFNFKLLNILGRNHTKEMVINGIKNIKDVGIDNINIDMIYGISGETLNDLKEDINTIINLPITHVSFYSLIIEPHTKLYINNFKEIDEDLNYEMYQFINIELSKYGYHQYEISNYSKEEYESIHNLVYWHNEHYYGFGLGASSFINNTRYDNTRNLNKYIDGNYILNINNLTNREMMENEMILGLRLRNGVNREAFYKKYHQNMEDVFKIDDLVNRGLIINNTNFLYIPDDKVFISNSILIEFLE